MKIVSVIIPVYNTENYIRDCIESVLVQSLDEVEIICVEDCSTDGSMKILEEYQKDGKIRLHKNLKNSGLSESRNNGIRIATGEYLLFLDSDDMLGVDALKHLYNKAKKDNSDVVFFNFESRAEGCDIPESEMKYCSEGSYAGVMTGGEFLNATFENHDERIPACLQFWNRNKYNEYRMTFTKGLLHEDILFTFTTFMRAQRVSFLNEQLYIYRRRAGSITLRKVNDEYLRSMIYIYSAIENLIMEYTGVSIDASANQFLVNLKWVLEQNKIDADIKNDDLKKLWGKESILYKKYLQIVGFDEEKEEDKKEQIEKKIIVYGAGKIAKYCIPKIKALGIDVYGVAVSNTDGNPETLYGIRVKNIKDYLGIKEQCMVLICVGGGLQWNILESLKEMGFSDCRI